MPPRAHKGDSSSHEEELHEEDLVRAERGRQPRADRRLDRHQQRVRRSCLGLVHPPVCTSRKQHADKEKIKPVYLPAFHLFSRAKAL